MKSRLQKIIAHAGICSRRRAEELIAKGYVNKNAVRATTGESVEAGDKLQIEGKHFLVKSSTQFDATVLAYYKPEGEIVSRADPKHKKSVFHQLPRLKQGRWITVGRLDINTSGLLLFTNHGELANRLMHPSYEIEREYAVRVLGTATEKQISAMKEGVESEGDVLKFDDITDAGGEGTNHWYHVTLSEGKNHEVRRIWKEMNLMVSRLIRIRYGNLALSKEMSRGKWRYLKEYETKKLLSSVSMESTGQETLYLESLTKKGNVQRRRR